MTALVEIEGLSKSFPIRRGPLRRQVGEVRALEGVDLEIERGESFGLVGESGSGKTTLGRCLLGLETPTAGRVRFDGHDIGALEAEPLRRLRRRFQVVFQDPFGSLNPRMRVETLLSEPLEVHSIVPRAERGRRVRELLELVGLPREAARRYPHEFSGGQRQRIGIARALATEPELLVADEPVSALDVSVRAQIINLLAELKERLGLTLLLIAHDLAVVEQVADRVGVLYLGRLVEVGPARRVFESPRHPYTASLLSAVPIPDPERVRDRIVLAGEPPSPSAPPPGCAFHPRCPIAVARCADERPRLEPAREAWQSACHFPGGLAPDGRTSSGGTFEPPIRSTHRDEPASGGEARSPSN